MEMEGRLGREGRGMRGAWDPPVGIPHSYAATVLVTILIIPCFCPSGTFPKVLLFGC